MIVNEIHSQITKLISASMYLHNIILTSGVHCCVFPDPSYSLFSEHIFQITVEGGGGGDLMVEGKEKLLLSYPPLWIEWYSLCAKTLLKVQ